MVQWLGFGAFEAEAWEPRSHPKLLSVLHCKKKKKKEVWGFLLWCGGL